jgi:hypothetical protein
MVLNSRTGDRHNRTWSSQRRRGKEGTSEMRQSNNGISIHYKCMAEKTMSCCNEMVQQILAPRPVVTIISPPYQKDMLR